MKAQHLRFCLSIFEGVASKDALNALPTPIHMDLVRALTNSANTLSSKDAGCNAARLSNTPKLEILPKAT